MLGSVPPRTSVSGNFVKRAPSNRSNPTGVPTHKYPSCPWTIAWILLFGRPSSVFQTRVNQVGLVEAKAVAETKIENRLPHIRLEVSVDARVTINFRMLISAKQGRRLTSRNGIMAAGMSIIDCWHRSQTATEFEKTAATLQVQSCL